MLLNKDKGMKKFRYPILIISCLLLGAFFFLIQRKWLIICWTFNPIQSSIPIISKDNSIQQRVKLYFAKDEKFRHEDATIIWNLENKNDTLKHLVDSWLSILHDEKIFSKKLTVESIGLNTSEQDAYISLNQIFPWQEWSIAQKWLTLESLLKTIKESGLGIKFVSILVNDKPLEDPHLSFIQPWPIEGFR
jgi:hypothetical protein